MSVIKINAIEVPEGQGPELESRFAARKHAVDSSPGFKGFQLLRPTKGEDRYFVVTEWETADDFENWRSNRAPAEHATGASLLEFEVVNLDEVEPAAPANPEA